MLSDSVFFRSRRHPPVWNSDVDASAANDDGAVTTQFVEQVFATTRE